MGINLTFTPQELFLEKNDNLYFYIAYSAQENDDWYMGTIFFEKYLTVFNNDAKMLSILKLNNKNKNESKDNKTYQSILIIVLIIVLSALIFGFLGINYGKLRYNQRKKKANELSDDEYDYTAANTPQSINDEKKNQNHLIDNN